MRTSLIVTIFVLLAVSNTVVAQEVQLSFWDAVGLPQGFGMKPGEIDVLPPLHPLYKPRSDFQEIQGSEGTRPSLKVAWPAEAANENPIRQREEWDKRFIPPDEYQKLFEEAAAVPSEGEPLSPPPAKTGFAVNAAVPPSDRWAEIGVGITHPSNNASGRVTSARYAYDYSQGLTTIWVGTPGGGIWKVVNLGLLAVWAPVGDKLPGSPAAGAFVVDRRDSNRIVVGTGDYNRENGTGFYWTRDGGLTWTRSWDLSFTPSAVYRMQASVDNPDVIFAATSRGIFRSLDGGMNWDPRTFTDTTDIVQDPRSPLVWYGAVPGVGVVRTDDGGRTYASFAPIAGNGGNGLPDPILRMSLALCAAAPNYLYAVVEGTSTDPAHTGDRGVLNGIYRSRDYGINWEPIDTMDGISWGQGFHANAIAVDPNTPDRVIVGMGGAQITKNATEANVCWTRNVGDGCAGCSADCIDGGHPDFTSFTFAPGGGMKIVITNDGGYYVYDYGSSSVSGLANRIGLNISEASVPFNSFAVARTNSDLMLLGLQDNGQVRIDRNVPTAMIRFFAGGDGGQSSIAPEDENHWFYSWGAAFRRLYSLDRGATETNVNCDLADQWAPSVIVDQAAGLSNPNIYTHDDYAVFTKPVSASCDWTKLTADVPFKIKQVDVGTSAIPTLYLTGWGDPRLYVIERTEPLTVTDRTPVVTSGEAFVAADRSGLFPDSAFYVRGGQLFITDTKGTSWTPVSGDLPSLVPSAYLFPFELIRNPLRLRQLFLATNVGVFRSDNAGANWYRYTSGMPANAIVFGIELSYDGLANPVVRIATKGRGVWERTVGPRRADINLDGIVDPSDAIYLINTLFGNGPQAQSPCAADMNGDGKLNVTDIFYLINYLYAKGPVPPPC